MMSDAEIIEWIADRLTTVYGESPNVDFVQRLREVKTAEQAQQRIDELEIKIKWLQSVINNAMLPEGYEIKQRGKDNEQ